MGRDNQPKARQLARKDKKEARRSSYARILIVTEGSKTEPLYFEDIRSAYQLHSANVAVQPGLLGTAPTQVVNYARKLFEEGDLHRGIRPKSFDEVYAVFDRDEHDSYFEALNLAEALNGKLRNDNNERVSFKAIASVPCFELWLLLHYVDIHAPLHRDEVIERLKHRIPDYHKGTRGIFADTRAELNDAILRAQALSARFNAYTAPEPFTAVHELVARLTTLRD